MEPRREGKKIRPRSLRQDLQACAGKGLSKSALVGAALLTLSAFSFTPLPRFRLNFLNLCVYRYAFALNNLGSAAWNDTDAYSFFGLDTTGEEPPGAGGCRWGFCLSNRKEKRTHET